MEQTDSGKRLSFASPRADSCLLLLENLYTYVFIIGDHHVSELKQ